MMHLLQHSASRCQHHTATRHASSVATKQLLVHTCINGSSTSSSRHVCVATSAAAGGSSNAPSLDDSGWGELAADSGSSRSSRSSTRQQQQQRSSGSTGGRGTTTRPQPPPPRPPTHTTSSGGSATRIRKVGQQRRSSSRDGADGADGADWRAGEDSRSSSNRWFSGDEDDYSGGAGGGGVRRAPPSSSRQPGGGGTFRQQQGSSSSRPPPPAGAAAVADHPDALPGDWVCSDCGELNFARRQECRSCFAARPPRAPQQQYNNSYNNTSSSSAPAFTPQPGDWTCPQCSDVNFAWRTECRSCQEPRPKGAGGANNSKFGANSKADSRTAKKPKVKKASALLVVKGVACCYGCGAPLQSAVPAAAGYVAADRFEAKKKHRQLQQVLCGRCQDLAHGAMIPAVKDFTQKAWIQQQEQLLLQKQQQDDDALNQQQQQQGSDGAQPSSPAAAAADGGGFGVGVESSSSSSSSSREPLELLGKVLVTAEELRDKIAEVSSVKALVVMLVDLLDVSGTLMGKVRDMVGNNPIVLVGTKLDLMPPGCSPKEVAAWLTEAAARRRLQVTSTHLISSRSGEGVSAVASKIARERKGRDVFVVGAANVGKSAFVRALLKEMSSLAGGNFDAAAASTSRYLPVESAMPGTTLGIIPLQAFETGGTLYDTPGVHLHHRVPHMLSPEELKLLHPRRRLTPFRPPTPLQVVMDEQEEGGEEGDDDGSQWKDRKAPTTAKTNSKKPKFVSASYLWSGLVRVDVLSGPPSTSLVFYGPHTLRVAALPLIAQGQEVEIDFEGGGDEEEDEGRDEEGSDVDGSSSSSSSSQSSSSSSSSSRQKKSGGSSTKQVLVCSESVAARGGLVPHVLHIPMPGAPTSQCLADVAVSGLPGWVSLYAPFASQPLELRVWVPRGVEVFLRPPIPCPPPPKPSSARGLGEDEEDEEGADGSSSSRRGVVGADDLADIGSVLDAAEGDWEQHRSQLGLKPMSAEDEEVIKMLLYGNEAQGLTGIVDMEDEDWEEEEDEEDEGESSSSPAAAASSSSSSGDAGEADGDIASMVARALQAETLAATAADAVGKKAPAVKTRQGQGITIVEGDDDDAGGAAGAARRRRRW